MKSYHDARWKAFRLEVIEMDGGQCIQCGRIANENTVLQVHHRRYVSGKRPWEYATKDCYTLCKGCHAQVHGKIRPSFGWELFGDFDLGDLSGNCEYCGTSLRYEYHVQHENWEPMIVGADCCDKLTGTCEASEHKNESIRTESRMLRFIDSPRWRSSRDYSNDYRHIRQSRIYVEILPTRSKFKIRMNGRTTGKLYGSLVDAKRAVFLSIDSGKAQEYLEELGARSW